MQFVVRFPVYCLDLAIQAEQLLSCNKKAVLLNGFFLILKSSWISCVKR